jgi:hypothetical protein
MPETSEEDADTVLDGVGEVGEYLDFDEDG